jgi:beta-glucosidase
VVNGIRTACSYDLCTKILRQEWGFKGIVMTDWWTKICNGAEISAEDGYKLMLDAQNDIYMVTNDGSDNPYIDKTLELLEQGLIQRGVLQRSAYNVCYFAMNTLAMKRMLKTADTYEILGRPEEENQDDIASMEYIPMEDYLEYALDYKESKKGTNYIIPVDVAKAGIYEITLTGRSSMGELAQIPCSIFAMGTPAGTFTFNGTGGKSVSITRDAICFGHKLYFRIYVGANGVELEKIEFRLKREGLPTDL